MFCGYSVFGVESRCSELSGFDICVSLISRRAILERANAVFDIFCHIFGELLKTPKYPMWRKNATNRVFELLCEGDDENTLRNAYLLVAMSYIAARNLIPESAIREIIADIYAAANAAILDYGGESRYEFYDEVRRLVRRSV